MLRKAPLLQNNLAYVAATAISLIALVAVCMTLVTANPTNKEPLIWTSMFLAFMTAVPFVTWHTLYVQTPSELRKQSQSQERLRLETTYEFDEDQIVITDRYTVRRSDWGNFQSVFETKNLYVFVFTTNKSYGQFIAKRAFETEEQEEAFRELIGRKLGFKGK
jgi:hypothetical protein